MTDYPWYIADVGAACEMSRWCAAELAEWRAVKLRHRAGRSVERRLAMRPELERAYNTLRDAYLSAGRLAAVA